MGQRGETWNCLGAGTIGGALLDMVAKPEVAHDMGLAQYPSFVLRRDGWHEGGKNGPIVEKDPTKLPDGDVLLNTYPTMPNHFPLLTLMRQQLARGGEVITAEKGTLSDNFGEFSDVGYWATVGGGTKLLPSLELHTQDPRNIREIHLALNATLTYIFGEVGSGQDVNDVVEAATKMGYAEPGATDAYDVIYGEAAGDVPRKLAIVWNTIFSDTKELSPGEIKTELTQEDVIKALSAAHKYRYLVSMFPVADRERAEKMTESRIGGFSMEHEEWVIIGGLMRVNRTNKIGKFMNSNGPNAGFYVGLGPQDNSTNDGKTFLMGTGAGGAPTATAMLDNLQYLRRQKLRGGRK